jgi:phosphopantothenate-cysteine ligase
VNYLVTAGAASERIDGVRSITNFATGRLGSLIAESLSAQRGTQAVFYVCGRPSVRPGGAANVRVFEVEGVTSLEERVRVILRENKIDAIVHSMAVSDYQVDRVLDGNGRRIETAGKIGSSERELHIILKPAKKIIGLFHELSPDSLLAGFKLLSNASEEALTEAAYALLEKHHCVCVLANDLSGISGSHHAAFLIDAHKNKTYFNTKEQIAAGICRFIGECGNRAS